MAGTGATNETTPGAVTRLLQEYTSGVPSALDAVVALVYQELQQLARAQLRRSSVREQHVETSILVHEAYEKLVLGQSQEIQDRRHFFAIASRAMRQIVVDQYRSQQTKKRGGELVAMTMTQTELVDLSNPERLFAVDEAIEKLAQQDAELARIVDMACFAGLSNSDIAELLDINLRSVQRKIKRAQAWLALYLNT